MTLKELRSKFLQEVQDFNTPLFPDKNGLIREGIRDLLHRLGGIQRTTTITTVEGQREYGISDGFPTDFVRVDTVWHNTTRLRQIFRRERNEASANGTPSAYYIWGRSIGFDVPCNGSVGDITFNYYGLGDDVTGDTDTVLAELPIVDDDPVWEAITNYCALKYYQRERAEALRRKDWDSIKMLISIIKEKRLEYLDNKARAIRTIRGYNADKGIQRKLPEDYFRRLNYYRRYSDGYYETSDYGRR